MVRHCFVCGKEITKSNTMKEWMFKKGVCSQKCDTKSRDKYREQRKEENRCIVCGKDLPPSFTWNNIKCPECAEKDKNSKFYGKYATEYELRVGVKR